MIDEIFETYARLGKRSYGEDVTQMDHMLQCAMFASAQGASEELIAAALLHDYGHFLEEAGDAAELESRDACHESLGAAWLSQYFPTGVTGPIALHVAAKRYLCACEPGYLDSLSNASRLSLRLQGGPFTSDEARLFIQRPYAAEALKLRHFDDKAKQIGLATPDIEHYRPLLRRLLQR